MARDDRPVAQRPRGRDLQTGSILRRPSRVRRQCPSIRASRRVWCQANEPHSPLRARNLRPSSLRLHGHPGAQSGDDEVAPESHGAFKDGKAVARECPEQSCAISDKLLVVIAGQRCVAAQFKQRLWRRRGARDKPGIYVSRQGDTAPVSACGDTRFRALPIEFARRRFVVCMDAHAGLNEVPGDVRMEFVIGYRDSVCARRYATILAKDVRPTNEPMAQPRVHPHRSRPLPARLANSHRHRRTLS
jgi:hypothetical protein